jgi:hypothetical protein
VLPYQAPLVDRVTDPRVDSQIHVVDDGDGICGDCLWCEENVDNDCNVPGDPKCAWCGHCLGNHAQEDTA